MTIVVEQISPHHPKARALLDAMTKELIERYPSSEEHGFGPEQAKDGVMMVAWLEAETVACGVLRPLVLPDVAEIKRLFVQRNHRRKGLARKILDELEAMAVKLNYKTIRLETGTRQPEAIALYERSGYHRIECYGEYADDPFSVCFEKRIVSC